MGEGYAGGGAAIKMTDGVVSEGRSGATSVWLVAL